MGGIRFLHLFAFRKMRVSVLYSTSWDHACTALNHIENKS